MLVIASADTDITTAVASLVPCCSPAKLGVKKSRCAQFWLHICTFFAQFLAVPGEPQSRRAPGGVFRVASCGWYRWSLTPGPN